MMESKKSIFILVFLVFVTFGLTATAQEARVSNIQKENIFEIVAAQLKEINVSVESLDMDNQVLTSDYCEYSAGLFTNRARLIFKCENNELIVKLDTRQTKTSSGWTNAILPSKKADDKLIQSFASRIEVAKSSFVSNEKPKSTSTGTTLTNLIGASSIEQLQDKNAKSVVFDDEDTYEFSEGLCAVHRDNLWAFIDTLGNIVIDFKFGSNGQPKFRNGICNLFINTGEILNKFVSIDKTGKILFPDKNYTYVSNFSEGMAIAERKIGAPYLSLINTKGEPIPGAIIPDLVAISWSQDFLNFSEGLSPMFSRKLDATGYINTKGLWVIKPTDKYSQFTAFHEGLAFVLDKTTGKWGAINTKGEVVIPFQFINMPGIFSDGLAAVVNRENMVGYIDKSGKVVINCLYKDPQLFVNGHTIVLKDDSYVCIDKTGREINIGEFSSSMSEIQPSGIAVFEGRNAGGRGVIATDGRIILNPENYNLIGKFNDGLAYAESMINDKWIRGFINIKGKYVIVLTKQEF